MKIKPCPFCGGEAKWWDTEDSKYPYQIICESCFCGTDAKPHKEYAIRAWNRREPIDKVVEQLESVIGTVSGHKNNENNCGGCAGCTKCKMEDAYKDALEIVKKGGVSDETCKG